MLTQNVYTIGTAATTVVAPTVDSARYVLKNLEPSPFMGDLASKGYVYSVTRYFSIANNGTASFSFTTGPNGAQFEHWKFSAGDSSILASLIEGATITTTGAEIPAYNLNRSEGDDYDAELYAASVVTGGTTVLTQYTGASNQTGGGADADVPVTLKPNTEYAFRFVDVGGNGPNVHIQIDWAENYNGYNDIWLAAPDDSFLLHGGEEISMYLHPYETINATAGSTGRKLAVMRQD